ncbi:hypothetical protein KP22_14140 [Pectobacterium betavasculorum]|uniref:Uncharacterized protein n=1 Tax=Pectobacterium betavasculorum TaxID=55207 RepID=A0A093VHK6_9GAMM|nr:hypothetical protein [Pectobacterium betavasculorum]KFX03992.1 hypothetical protein KP22_14140 [Pectobacterium betavasculorum]KFX20033.1 hypothetical protein JV35_11230 [Pectobacterium betavasculorum]
MKVEAAESSVFASQQVMAKRSTDHAEKAELSEQLQSYQAGSGVVPAGQTTRYDFTRISPAELYETVDSLVSSGQLGREEGSALLSFISSPRTESGSVPPSNVFQPINVFDTIQQGVAGASSRSEVQNTESLQRAAEALNRFQGQVSSISVYV